MGALTVRLRHRTSRAVATMLVTVTAVDWPGDPAPTPRVPPGNVSLPRPLGKFVFCSACWMGLASARRGRAVQRRWRETIILSTLTTYWSEKRLLAVSYDERDEHRWTKVQLVYIGHVLLTIAVWSRAQFVCHPLAHAWHYNSLVTCALRWHIYMTRKLRGLQNMNQHVTWFMMTRTIHPEQAVREHKIYCQLVIGFKRRRELEWQLQTRTIREQTMYM